MDIQVKTLPKSQAEITVEVTPEEAKPHLEAAASRLSKEKPIDGFRPGHAPYDAVVRAYGEMAVYELALQTIVVKTYANAISEHKLQTYGEPDVNVKQLVPGNPIGYTATVTVVPKVTNIADVRKLKVKLDPKKIDDKDVDKAIEELTKMRANEVAVDREVQGKDKITVDMDMSRDNVPLDGGQARDHGIYLDDDYYIPGLKDKLLGAKAGDTREFTLKFPTEHFQKNLAGSDVDFKVTVKQVFEIQRPAADDELAKSLGQESLDKLKGLIRGNMEQEATDQAQRAAENQALEKLVEQSQFDDIPEAMINEEIGRMIQELQHEIAHRGMDFEKYLEDAGKNLGQLKLDFAAPALKRVQSALLMRAIADAENIEVTEPELVEEQTKLLNKYSNDAEAQAKIKDEDFLTYIRASLKNRKVMEFIREHAIQK
jgi:trigger factor